MAEYCVDGRFRVTRIGSWGAVDHYAPKAGKLLTLAEYDTSRFSYDRTHWGFEGLEIAAGNIDAATATGFAVANLIVALYPTGWSEAVDLGLSKSVMGYGVRDLMPGKRISAIAELEEPCVGGGPLPEHRLQFIIFRLFVRFR